MPDKIDKIDTQGMSGGPIQEGSTLTKANKYSVDPVTGKVIYPPMPVMKKRILPKNESLYNELKELIVETMNEVLDERAQ